MRHVNVLVNVRETDSSERLSIPRNKLLQQPLVLKLVRSYCSRQVGSSRREKVSVTNTTEQTLPIENQLKSKTFILWSYLYEL